MQAIMVEWAHGGVEVVDSCESEAEAIYLVEEYRIAYGPAAVRVYIQLEDK